jgi:glutamyl-tRNA synthetase
VLANSEALPDDDNLVEKVIGMVQDRCTLLSDFQQQAGYFFATPALIDTDSIRPKWDDKKNLFFTELTRALELTQFWDKENIEKEFKEIASVNGLKPGDLMLPFRIMLVGGKFGPGVFDIAALIGKEETVERIKRTQSLLGV